MISQTALTAYLWGAYAWFAIGVLLIAVPALRELMNRKQVKKKPSDE